MKVLNFVFDLRTNSTDSSNQLSLLNHHDSELKIKTTILSKNKQQTVFDHTISKSVLNKIQFSNE